MEKKDKLTRQRIWNLITKKYPCLEVFIISWFDGRRYHHIKKSDLLLIAQQLKVLQFAVIKDGTDDAAYSQFLNRKNKLKTGV